MSVPRDGAGGFARKGSLGAVALIFLLLFSTAGRAAEEARPDVAPFVVEVHIHGPGGLSSAVSLGTAVGATDGYDRGLDVVAPPPPPGSRWLQSILLAAEARADFARLERSFVPVRSSASWPLRIGYDGDAGSLVLTWSAAAFESLDPRLIVELSIQGEVVDMRSAEAVERPIAAGRQQITGQIDIRFPSGLPPSAPQDLRAIPLARLGYAELVWNAPMDDGGQPILNYDILRDDGDGQGPRVVSSTPTRSIRVATPSIGSTTSFSVRAENVIGQGPPSDAALAPGTQWPSIGRSPQDEPWLTVELEYSGATVDTPELTSEAVRGEQRSDHYAITLRGPVGGDQDVEIYDAGAPLPPFAPRIATMGLELQGFYAAIHAGAQGVGWRVHLMGQDEWSDGVEWLP